MDIQLATRPMQPDDEARLHRLWPRLSPDTVYRRFHSPIRARAMPRTKESLRSSDGAILASTSFSRSRINCTRAQASLASGMSRSFSAASNAAEA